MTYSIIGAYWICFCKEWSRLLSLPQTLTPLMERNAPILPPKPSHHDVSRMGTPLNAPASPAHPDSANIRGLSPSNVHRAAPDDDPAREGRAVGDPGDTWIPPAIQELG